MNWITPLLLALAGGLFAASLPAAAQQIKTEEDRVVPTLTVNGRAELEKAADQLHLSLGVLTEGKEAQETVRENSRTMQRVIEAIERLGLSEDEYETRRFNISPRYDHRRQQATGGMPEIIGYRVENSLLIKTTKLELVGRLIEVGTQAGANSIAGLSFGLADARQHRAEAIAEAVKNASADATALAEAAGVRLVRILSISLDGAASPPIPLRGERMMMAAAMEGGTPIQPGDVTVHANVTIVYEIEQTP